MCSGKLKMLAEDLMPLLLTAEAHKALAWCRGLADCKGDPTGSCQLCLDLVFAICSNGSTGAAHTAESRCQGIDLKVLISR